MSRASQRAGATGETRQFPGGAYPLGEPRLGAPAIAARLRQAIRDGDYAQGERLPAERQLAQALGTSRTTVREALGALEQAGMVTRRVGSGTYVTWRADDGDADVADITSPLELIDVRLALEPAMVRLATVNATPRDLARIGRALAALESAGADPDRFTRSDRQFHERLAEATHNPLLVALYRQINQVRGHRQWSAMKDKILTRERIRAYNLEHRGLYQALVARDGEAGAKLVARHLERARRHLAGG